MADLNIPLIAILFGLINTVVIHLAKSMERHGIEIFDRIRDKFKKEEPTKPKDGEGKKKPMIYIVGMIIHQTSPIWATLANIYGKAPYYTSIFPVGLIILLLYSSRILDENIEKLQYIGSALIIVGTLVIGVENIFRPEYTEPFDFNKGLMVMVICGVIGIIGVVIASKKKQPFMIGIIFGLFAGASGGLDPTIKDIAQEISVGNVINSPFSWFPIYLFSFLLGGIALVITESGFARDAKASILVPFLNVSFVIVPFLVYAIALPGFAITIYTVIGLMFSTVGILMVGMFQKEPKNVLQNLKIE